MKRRASNCCLDALTSAEGCILVILPTFSVSIYRALSSQLGNFFCIVAAKIKRKLLINFTNYPSAVEAQDNLLALVSGIFRLY